MLLLKIFFKFYSKALIRTREKSQGHFPTPSFGRPAQHNCNYCNVLGCGSSASGLCSKHVDTLVMPVKAVAGGFTFATGSSPKRRRSVGRSSGGGGGLSLSPTSPTAPSPILGGGSSKSPVRKVSKERKGLEVGYARKYVTTHTRTLPPPACTRLPILRRRSLPWTIGLKCGRREKRWNHLNPSVSINEKFPFFSSIFLGSSSAHTSAPLSSGAVIVVILASPLARSNDLFPQPKISTDGGGGRKERIAKHNTTPSPRSSPAFSYSQHSSSSSSSPSSRMSPTRSPSRNLTSSRGGHKSSTSASPISLVRE